MTKEEFENNQWRYYLILEEEFMSTLNYVELDLNNYSTFSIIYIKLLLQIGAEIDNMFKICCDLSGRKNITDYINPILIKYPKIKEQKVSILNYDITLQPFENWDNEQPSKSLIFWKRYNNIKHDRILNHSEASLETVINALAALFILEMYLFNDMYIVDTNLSQNIPSNESNVLVLNDWKLNIRPSKISSQYEIYDDDKKTRLL